MELLFPTACLLLFYCFPYFSLKCYTERRRKREYEKENRTWDDLPDFVSADSIMCVSFLYYDC